MKNRRAIMLLFSAHMVSSFAHGITMLAIPWYFTSVVSESGLFGKVLALATLLSLFWSLYAGTLIDRYPRRNILLVAALSGMTFIGAIAAFCGLTGTMPIHLVALAFVFTFFGYNIHYPNLYAFTQELAARGDYGRVNSIIEVVGQSTSVLSGGVGALLLSGTVAGNLDLMGITVSFPFDVRPWELWEIFALDAVAYAAAACIIPFIRYERIGALHIDTEPIAARLRRGIRFLTLNRSILMFGIASYAIFITILVETMYLLALYTDRHLTAGADVYASSEVYFALGSLVAGLLIRSLTKKIAPARAIVMLMVFAGLLFLLASSVQSVVFLYIFSMLLGFANAGTRILRVTFLFEHIPNNIIGRANSIFYLYNILARSALLSLFALPFFSLANNVVWGYGVCGVFILLSAVPMAKLAARLKDLKVVEVN
ncbi:MAG: MFS transporter [Flavobacteriales bacterium]|nr:MFS transporter [Flavobacteriales bacterium]